MKLNNLGWGYRQMLLLTSILLIFLLIAAYNIYALYNELDTKDAIIYSTLESKLESAASQYIFDNDIENESIIISLFTLQKEGYISRFHDADRNVCNGYVKYENNQFQTYIKCPNYTSKNYEEITQ